MTKMTRADQLAAIVEKNRELRKHVADSSVIVKAVDGVRMQLEDGQNGQAYATLEVSGQVGIVKERQKWVIDRQDELDKAIKRLIKEFGRTTQPGDSR